MTTDDHYLALVNARNQYGVKSSCDQYRTINGVLCLCWSSDNGAARVKSLRAQGITAYLRAGDVYIPAIEIDAAAKAEDSY